MGQFSKSPWLRGLDTDIEKTFMASRLKRVRNCAESGLLVVVAGWHLAFQPCRSLTPRIGTYCGYSAVSLAAATSATVA